RLFRITARYRHPAGFRGDATVPPPSAGAPLRKCPTRHSFLKLCNGERTPFRTADVPRPPLEGSRVQLPSRPSRTEGPTPAGGATKPPKGEARRGLPHRAPGSPG